MPDTLNIFVSSTSKDLTKHREKVREVIGMIRFPRCHAVIMEEFTAGDQNALEKCYAELLDADIFVGIYAHRYGWQPDTSVTYVDNNQQNRCGDGKTSVTEWEYIWAKELGIPMLLFVADESDIYKWDEAFIDKAATEQLKAFKAQIQTQVVGFFNQPDNLAYKVFAAAHEHIVKSYYPNASDWHILRAEEPRYFVGRDSETRDILEKLAKSKTVLMTGMGGTGKTTLARHIAREALVTYGGGVLWLGLSPDVKKAEDAQIRAIAAWKEAHLKGRQENVLLDAESLKKLLAQAPAPLLAILDDAWTSDVIKGIRACLPDDVPLLVTCRDASLLSVASERHDLKSFSEEDALDFLNQRLHLDGTYDEDLEQISTSVGNHTLALELIVTWLQRESIANVTAEFPSLISKLRYPKGLFKTLRIGEDRDENLEKALELSYVPLEEELQSAFRLLSALPSGLDFTPELAFAVWGVGDEAQEEADDKLRELARVGLLERLSNGRYLLHQMLHFYAQKLIDDKEETETKEKATIAYLTKIYELVEGFSTLSQVNWHNELEEPYLLHILLLGNVLVSTKTDDMSDRDIRKFVEFFLNTRTLVFYRREYQLLAWLEKGLEESSYLQNKESEMLFLNDIGSHYLHNGEIEIAQAYIEKALSLAEELDDEAQEISVVCNLAAIYLSVNKLAKAQKYYHHALKISRKLGRKDLESSILSHLGVIHRHKGNLDKALEFYLAALETSETVGDTDTEAGILYNIGMLYLSKDELELALEYCSEALKRSEAIGNIQQEADSLTGIGMVYEKKKDFNEALKYYDTALLLAQESGRIVSIGRILNNMGLVYENLGKTKAAFNAYTRALELRQQSEDKRGECETSWNFGLHYFNKKQYDLAIKYVENAVSVAEEIGFPSLENYREMLSKLKTIRSLLKK